MVLGRTHDDTHEVAHVLAGAAPDPPGIGGATHNVPSPDSDADTLAAFTDTVRRQQHPPA